MPWPETFLVFVVSHLVGDYVLQTEWQATNKYGGLGPNPEARRALLSHVGLYTLAFVPAFIWLGNTIGGGATLGIAVLIFAQHTIQDDGRLLEIYMRRVKGLAFAENRMVTMCVDQSLHVLMLFAMALLAS